MEERPTKRTKLLSEDESSDGSDAESHGGIALKVNDEYARRFEHNSRRAELHRLEAKLGPDAARKALDGKESESESSSEEEDEDGELAQGELDQQFQAVLAAIRNKDPKIYDPKATFYSEIEEEGGDGPTTDVKKEKAVYLNDYHRQNLLSGNLDDGDEEEKGDTEPTYVQQQAELKRNVTQAMHDAAGAEAESEGDADDGFLVAKPRAKEEIVPKSSLSKEEIEHADENPEAFLNKFIESRAWVQTPASQLHPFDSDDDDEDARADAIEEAYNMRFEDPDKANEQLKSHARDAAAKFSTRKDKLSQRQRTRETERERKEIEKQQRSQEKARLRKLRLEEAEEKLERIREAAGVQADDLDVEDWQDFLTEDWDDQRWEKEMQKRFGDNYYEAASDAGSMSGDDGSKRKKPRKPKWDDDIDIGDLVPDFEPDDEKHFSLSEAEEGDADPAAEEKGDKKKKKKDRAEEKRKARKEKRLLEQLVDEKLGLDEVMEGVTKSKGGAGFRYRETSPVNFGMTSRDILMASDSQLNQYAGLKKMSAFREEEKKRKDRKRLGKKARLRQWRRDTFGDAEGPRKTLQDVVREELEAAGGPSHRERNGVDVREGKRRQKRKRQPEA